MEVKEESLRKLFIDCTRGVFLVLVKFYPTYLRDSKRRLRLRISFFSWMMLIKLLERHFNTRAKEPRCLNFCKRNKILYSSN